MSITSGIVSIEDGIKAAEEYAPARKARVELHFDIPEGSDPSAHIAGVSEVAKTHLHRLLTNKVVGAGHPEMTTLSARPTTAQALAPQPTQVLEVINTPTVKPAKAPKEKTKADLAREAGLPTKDVVQKGRPAKPAPALIEEEELNAPTEPEDDDDGLFGDSAPAPITDTEIEKAAQAKNALMKSKNPDSNINVRLRELAAILSNRVGDAKVKIREIPAAKRQEFLDKLKAME